MTQTDIEIIRTAAAFYRYEGQRLVDVRERSGLRPAQFWQRVNVLIEDPAAALVEPALVAQLRRQRDARAAVKRAG